MNRPPKEIWAHPHDEEGWSRVGRWNVEFAWHEDEQLYVRADVTDAAVAAALATAAAVAQQWWDDPSMVAAIRSLADDPAEVAAIIKNAAGEDRG